MKRIVLCASLLCLGLMLPFSVFGQNSPNYYSVKGGMYEPTGDIEDLGTGQNFEITFGHYFNPNFAFETTIGKFETDETFSGFDPFLGNWTEKDELSVIPITFSVKGVFPLETSEIYLGAGLGYYVADFDAKLDSSTIGNVSVSLKNTVFGFNLLVGSNVNISDKWFIGLEGKYIITADAKDTAVVFGVPITFEGNLNGYTLTGVIGFRF